MIIELSPAMKGNLPTFLNASHAAPAAVYMLLALSTLCIFNMIYAVQPLPFLDEIFHIPQAEKYCRGLFREDLDSSLQDLLSAVNLTIFPVLYFFTFLYYTDVIATGLILLTYLLQLDGRTLLAPLTAFIAVVVRQTNIVWVAFIAFLSISHVLKLHVIQCNSRLSPKVVRSAKYLQVLLDTLLRTWNRGFTSRAQLANNILYSSAGFIVVGLCFLGFVLWNGGLVVGDRSAHQAVFNIPQIFYFSLFLVIFSSPYIVGCVKQVLVSVIKHWKLVLVLMIGCIIIIHFSTYVHPYLLADNRHYTFYVWKRLYESHFLMKYLLIPVYIFSAFSVNQLIKETDMTFQIGYFTFISLCLVPQKLLEFRYFIVPFLMLRLHICLKAWWQLIAEFILFFCINASTVYLFMTRTFYWSDSEEVQRFLW
ncbi:putative Dol-P-Glc:Glc(2)Man(9)GlcNAc(2)-PP-Dol alpha-1,2-glucosyltransferase isoform X2 [Cryptotermes secundus]|uniref:putative Dol-P-Glc:Glc(2)Man(9)GlcNAc(2)-PP-Dol alpha-1,2-glucosyltransferase isoform X2 n=1 Tax=Cryptotermes secundus TaxID=105785 RepID=UPI000CD7D82F|nr:putative Dol-P-Glc:Glc(2)Man(9)GlcNAc(2)-PP-Dol alpha-1,2-glucosyltransferase isoform X2 [Cryptotermes secundus]